jgi:hypothetical protein
MAATKFPAIYSIATGRVRRYSFLDSDVELANVHPGQGEGILLFPIGQFGNHVAVQALVTAQTGIVPSNDRYVLIDGQGNYKGAILADVLCGDALPGVTLVQHATVNESWTISVQTVTLGTVSVDPNVVIVGTQQFTFVAPVVVMRPG